MVTEKKTVQNETRYALGSEFGHNEVLDPNSSKNFRFWLSQGQGPNTSACYELSDTRLPRIKARVQYDIPRIYRWLKVRQKITPMTLNDLRMYVRIHLHSLIKVLSAESKSGQPLEAEDLDVLELVAYEFNVPALY